MSNSGLPDNFVYSIAIDASGTKWIGTGDGLAAYNENGIPFSIGGNIIIENKVKIYPNPSSSHITIETPTTPHKNTFLTIYNLSGQQLIERQITEQQTMVDVSGLPTGVFFVRVVGDEGVMVGKVVKE